MIQKDLFEEMNSPELFRRAQEYGFRYLRTVSERNVFPHEEALAALSRFDEDLPREFTPFPEILEQLDRFGAPATVAQTGGRYFGFVDGGVIPAGLAVRVMTDFWDQNSALQVLSPAASRLEQVVRRWLISLFALPGETAAGFVSGTSMATFCGLAAARYRLLKRQGWDINEQGLFGAPEVRVVLGREAHSTVLKAVSLLGFGKGNIEWVDTDSQGRMIPGNLPVLDDKTLLVLQAGNVNTGAFDPFETLCEKAGAEGAWVHIDGAFGLWAAVSERLKSLTAGIEQADSWSADGHKTLNTPYDNGIILCRDGEALVSALHMTGDYIIPGKDRDGMYYTPEMSRRARIFELWGTLKSLGRSGMDEMVTGLHERALQFARRLGEEGFEILNEVRFNQVLVRYRDDESTMKVLKAVQEARVCWCGGSRWKGQEVIRISVCSWATTEEDVEKSVQSFTAARAQAGYAGSGPQSR